MLDKALVLDLRERMGQKKTSRTMPVIENMVVQLDTGS